MTRLPLTVFPVEAPVYDAAFDLHETIHQAIAQAGVTLQTGDVVAVSSKYAAVSEGRVVDLATVAVSDEAQRIADRYHMTPQIAQLVLDEADFVFGGIGLGFLLTAKDGILSPNAGLDRSNIPSGKAVLFSEHPYTTAANIREALQNQTGARLGVVLTDSWLVPGRWGTTGIALASAGFRPTRDERGKEDLFGNPMTVTVSSVADSISVAAQMVMGERDEATPLAVVRGANVELTDAPITAEDVAIDYRHCIYVESLTTGLLDESVLRAIAEADPFQQKRPAHTGE